MKPEHLVRYIRTGKPTGTLVRRQYCATLDLRFPSGVLYYILHVKFEPLDHFRQCSTKLF